MNFFRHLSLSSRLTLLALATLCPIVILTIVSYLDDRDSRRDDAIQSTVTYSESMAASLENFAQDLDSLALAASLALGSQVRINWCVLAACVPNRLHVSLSVRLCRAPERSASDAKEDHIPPALAAPGYRVHALRLVRLRSG